MKNLSLTKVLKHFKKASDARKSSAEKSLPELQLKMLQIQQGIFHQKARAIVMFEGFDAAGKGGAIKALTEMLDPRSFRVHSIAAPTAEEQGRHWLYRFWTNIPKQGNIAIFDRSWYGRVLVEKVEGLIPEKRVKEAYEEINQFEHTLQADGIVIIKIFIAITKDEQMERFEARLKDPSKQWKITEDDIRNRKKWDDYVDAVDEIFKKTDTKDCPWHLIEGNSKSMAREEVLKIVTEKLHGHGKWMEKKSKEHSKQKLAKALKELP